MFTFASDGSGGAECSYEIPVTQGTDVSTLTDCGGRGDARQQIAVAVGNLTRTLVPSQEGPSRSAVVAASDGAE